ncbi:hypothetical protein A6X21_05700 [Planctopirus hydrillae]|uniref:Uncharacterized protein n=1 Tax=Planctopirus hydrillae TaxID=1841610 RepID=A0A1C3EBC0_9PLAN|nr:hypothetical protein A6X21_05700 [Planctopirus hydrillae]
MSTNRQNGNDLRNDSASLVRPNAVDMLTDQYAGDGPTLQVVKLLPKAFLIKRKISQTRR